MRTSIVSSQTCEDPSELVDGIRVIVDTEVDVAIVPALVAAALSHDQQRRRLPATPVPPGRVAGDERGEQPVAQIALGLG